MLHVSGQMIVMSIFLGVMPQFIAIYLNINIVLKA